MASTLPKRSPDLTALNQRTLWPRLVWWDLENRRSQVPPSPQVTIELIHGLRAGATRHLAAAVFIIEAHDLTDGNTRGRILDILGEPGRPPTVLLTSFCQENVCVLFTLSVEEVAWSSEPNDRVVLKALRLAKVTARAVMAETLLDANPSDPVIGTAIENLFLSDSPPTQVQSLARACCVSTRTLERRWTEDGRGGIHLPLKVLLDWSLVLHGRELHQGGMPLGQIAKAVGVHERTLDRAAWRVGNSGFRAFASMGNDAVTQMIRQELFRTEDDLWGLS